MTQDSPLAIICAGGSLPFAVADAVRAAGRRVVLLALRGWADAERVAGYPHHWVGIGQFGAVCRKARAEGCQDIVLIGTLTRPPISKLRFDFAALRRLPRIVAAFRGGDNHLLSGVARAFEDEGFRLIGAHHVAPDILVPPGILTRRSPDEQELADIRCALALLERTGPFDVGQGAVVANNHVLAIEAAEGTDRMLARIAELRSRHSRWTAGGVLVKAPKPGQDRRFDLPSIGPQTIEGAARAALAGIAVVAGGAIAAEPQKLAALADERKMFVVGVRADGSLG